VVLVEGEKSADALQSALPKLAVISASNGANSAAKTDWSKLRDRRVVIWPDADAAGNKYSKDVIEIIGCLAADVASIIPPNTVREKWDAADAIETGWTTSQLHELISSAQPGRNLAQPGRNIERSFEPRESQEQVWAESEALADMPQRDQLICLGRDLELWHTADGKGHATAKFDGHFENWALNSLTFNQWLRGQYFDKFKTAPGNNSISEAIAMLEVLANRGSEHETFTRVAQIADCIYLDIGDPHWTIIKITKDGWQETNEPGAKFLRTSQIRQLQYPERGGSIDQLAPFFNVASPEDFKLIVGFLIKCLFPNGPFPILVFTGEQGSAKSTAARVVQSLVDPRKGGLRSPPKDPQNLFIAAQNNWCLGFDNISVLSNSLSDALCRLTHGGGYATRKLYSDTEETIIDLKRPVIMNGISDFVTRDDLAERSIVVTLKPIEEKNRKTEKAYFEEFERCQAKIQGALLDGLVAVLRNQGHVLLEELPRMADFVSVVTAAESALGWEDGSFLKAMERNRLESVVINIENDSVAAAVKSFIDCLAENEDWEGNATELLEKLNGDVDDEVRRSRFWPKAPAALSNRLRRVSPAMRALGYTMDFYKGADAGRKRLIYLARAGV
jgi:putative DNA primase/helicase